MMAEDCIRQMMAHPCIAFRQGGVGRCLMSTLAHRVVVTGLGLVTPLGVGVEENWTGLMQGGSAVREMKEEDLPERHRRFVNALSSRVVATVPREDLQNCIWRPKLDNRIALPFVDYAETAAAEALDDGKLLESRDLKMSRIGVSIGVGMSGTDGVTAAWDTMSSKSVRRMSPFFITKILPNMAAGSISVRYGFQGPNLSASTACAAGAHAIGDAFQLIKHGRADIMVAGGSESCIDAIAFAGFGRMKALSTKHNDHPARASRPFDVDRDGFVLGEGSGVVVLENLEFALDRNAKIYAEVCGYGLSGDGYHITHPHPSGLGAVHAMRSALDEANLPPSNVQYINAHATSTPVGDAIEQEAIRNVFGSAVDAERVTHVSSTKGAIGHLLGAAGAVEAVYTVLSIHHRCAPPTVNLSSPDVSPITTHIIKEPLSLTGSHIAALSNSFGFGGTNASLVFHSYN